MSKRPLKRAYAAAPEISTAQDFLRNKGKRRFGRCKAAERFGLTARMRSLSAGEKNDYERGAWNAEHTQLVEERVKLQKVRLIALCLVDREGNLIFDEDQIPELLELDAGLTDAVFVEVSRHVGFQDGEVEDLVKNSEAIRDAVSPSD